jgi:uncharacterized protein YcgL (UPF0745 family)
MNANELADELTKMFRGEEYDRLVHEIPNVLRQQQAEIDRLNYDMEGFKQNFFVSGFHLQIKMANEQLVKQQDEIDALKKELYFKDYYEELPDTPVDLLRKAQEK